MNKKKKESTPPIEINQPDIAALIERAKGGDVESARQLIWEGIMSIVIDELPFTNPLRKYFYESLSAIVKGDDANRALNIVRPRGKPSTAERDFWIAMDYWLTRKINPKELSTRTDVAKRWGLKTGTILRIQNQIGDRAKKEADRQYKRIADDRSNVALETAQIFKVKKSTLEQRVRFLCIAMSMRLE